MMDLNIGEVKKIYFIGIGGISMSGLAELLHNKGFEVSGSDLNLTKTTEHLENIGIKVFKGHDAAHVKGQELVIYTVAVNEDNPELQYARSSGIPSMERAVLLGKVMKHYPMSIGIAGTHGKTTTTSMISQILLQAEKDPTISLGGVMDSIGGNMRIGSSEYFVAESCEYHNSFLHLNPYIGIILNVEKDHMDFFQNMEAIWDSFRSFASRIPAGGALILQSSLEDMIGDMQAAVITFGLDEHADVRATDIQFDSTGCASFSVSYKGSKVMAMQLNVPGLHNVWNALAAVAAAIYLEIPNESIMDAMNGFDGVHRRFEFKGSFNEAKIYDDYAHHPTEIKATLDAAANVSHNRLWCIFQPHTYSRTKALLKDFSESFDKSDVIIITDIYAAREKDLNEIHARDLVNRLKEKGKNAIYMEDFKDIENYLSKQLEGNDLLITMGAGDIFKVGENLVG